MTSHRLFPVTNEDWADLGSDIKYKNPVFIDEVNDALTKIYQETLDVDDAKRWLVNKARELGVT